MDDKINHGIHENNTEAPTHRAASSSLRLPDMIICHSRFVLSLARQYGWKAGARYTNLRDVRHLNEVFFIDIDWKNYDFERHLWAVQSKKPRLTVARDVTDARELDEILHEAEKLSPFCERVIVVPKDAELLNEKRLGIPTQFRLGYSVPTKYGKTTIPPERFTGDVHLLGGATRRSTETRQQDERRQSRWKSDNARRQVRRRFRWRSLHSASQRKL